MRDHSGRPRRDRHGRPGSDERLDEAGIEYQLLAHDHTERASDEAAALGLEPDEVAKTVILSTPEGNLRAILPASERIDLHKLGELEGESRKQIQLVSEDELRRDYPEFELGAVPPLGGSRRDRVVVDRRVAELATVVVEAGSHEESIRIGTIDLIRLAEAEIADICRD